MSQLAERLLEKDTQRLGRIYRLHKDGKTLEDIRRALSHENPTNVLENLNVIKAMLEGKNTSELNKNETGYLALFIDRNRKEFPEAVVEWADQAIESLGGKSTILSPNNNQSKPFTPSPIKNGSPGIYAYSYPSLVTSSGFRSEDPLVKIGASGYSLEERLTRQSSQTEVPEDLMVLWTFPTTDKAEAFLLEQNVHRLLRLFGRWRKTAESGSEWFQVSIETLDELVKIIMGED